MPAPSALHLVAAPLFVLLWSTGFVGAKYGLPHAEPMIFLTLRFALAAAALGLWAWAAGEFRRDEGPAHDFGGAVFVGLLMHAVYLGGVFTAISLGAGAGLTALIVGLQPVATMILSRMIGGERPSRTQALGMAIGLAGVALVVARKLTGGVIGPWQVALCLLALLSISLASIVQARRGVRSRLAADAAVQYAAAGGLTLIASLLYEDQFVDWSTEFLGALAWMVIGLSIGAVSLYYILLRRGAATRTASLFFLVPGVTAAMAAAMFGERFGLVELAGLAAAMLGVRLATAEPAPDQAPAARR